MGKKYFLTVLFLVISIFFVKSLSNSSNFIQYLNIFPQYILGNYYEYNTVNQNRYVYKLRNIQINQSILISPNHLNNLETVVLVYKSQGSEVLIKFDYYNSKYSDLKSLCIKPLLDNIFIDKITFFFNKDVKYNDIKINAIESGLCNVKNKTNILNKFTISGNPTVVITDNIINKAYKFLNTINFDVFFYVIFLVILFIISIINITNGFNKFKGCTYTSFFLLIKLIKSNFSLSIFLKFIFIFLILLFYILLSNLFLEYKFINLSIGIFLIFLINIYFFKKHIIILIYFILLASLILFNFNLYDQSRYFGALIYFYLLIVFFKYTYISFLKLK
ncbi:hypothetical protein [Polynucleobacter sp. MWH-UH35A]|uniref:hypothetical protein n=1 Tax=Polynucleobacter sp. MWH-UH35A TaxID=1855619 RepID=UPI001BFD2A46|nr:hypothetical protein [Polynucleobacter sp. MWH-UH35A]QWD60452.1 hypothetical protein ICV36_01800 [Polynucleobacter sp. MWH-UH35A]